MNLFITLISAVVILAACGDRTPEEIKAQGEKSEQLRKEIRDRDAKDNHGVKPDAPTPPAL